MNDVFGLVLVSGVVLIVALWLALLPGKIAKRRHHRNADAIRICGIVGLFVWPAWFVALVWAYTSDVLPPSSSGPRSASTKHFQELAKPKADAEPDWLNE